MKKILAILLLTAFFIAIFAPSASASRVPLRYVRPMKFNESFSSSIEPLVAAPKPSGGSKWAVIIGIADYQGTSSDLWHPDEDAKEMYTELTRQRGYPKANVKLLTNKAATASAIVNAIDWLIATKNQETK